MTTGAQFADPVFKKLLSNEDLKDRMLEYMKEYVREHMERVYALDGVFSPATSAKWGLAGLSADTFRINPALALGGESKCVDGAGHILQLPLVAGVSEDLSLGKITDVVFENKVPNKYHVSLTYMERPRGIVINPRNGLPQYNYMQEGIGRSGAPDLVTDNGNGTITFRVDTVCDFGRSYAGRSVLVYMNVPARGATTESVAIEQCVVSWNGVNNTITTTGALGQDVISGTEGDYTVIALGPVVSATDYSGAPGYMYVGSIDGVGTGITPGAGDTTAQNVIDVSLSTLILYDGGPPWADGTANPATTIQAQLDKIITDLTSTTGQRGAAKLTAPAQSNWADGTANPAARLDTFIGNMINALITTAGQGGAARIAIGTLPTWADGFFGGGGGTLFAAISAIISGLSSTTASFSGARKIGTEARTAWADGTANVAATLYAAVDKIITDLNLTTGNGGADKIGIGARTTWLGGRTNPATRLYLAIDKIITDLAATTASDDGAERIGAQAQGNLAAGSVRSQLNTLEGSTGWLALANSWTQNNSFAQQLTGMGSALLGTAANNLLGRFVAAMGDTAVVGAGGRTLMFEFTNPNTGALQVPIRVYASQADGGGFEIAINCVWDNAGALWSKTVTGQTAWRLRVARDGVDLSSRNSAAAGSWTDAAVTGWNNANWHIYPVNTTPSMDMDDGVIRFRNIIVSNPGTGTTPQDNTLYALNIVKSWGKQNGNASLDDGFGITSQVANGLGCTLTLRASATGIWNQALVASGTGTTATTAKFVTVTHNGVNQFICRTWAWNGAAIAEAAMGDWDWIRMARVTS